MQTVGCAGSARRRAVATRRRSASWWLDVYSLMSDLIDAERSGAGGVTRAEGEAGEEGPPVGAYAHLEDHSPRPVWFGDVDLDAAGQAGAVSGLGVAALELVGRQPLGGELVAFSL